MIDLSTVVDSKTISAGYFKYDGYIFRPLTHPANIYDAIVIRNPSCANIFPSTLKKSDKSLDDHIKFVNDNKLEKALVIAENISFIVECPTLKHLAIFPSDTINDGFDFSPLYTLSELKSLKCVNTYGRREEHICYIDYSKINGLVALSVSVNSHTLNFNQIPSLKSLNIDHFNGRYRDLTDLFNSKKLDSLQMIQCGIRSLDGIEKSDSMQCLYLYYNRNLFDISALKKVKKTLRALRIQNCPKIEDFSVLGELENLELLELCGSNELPNLSFIKSMKKLKTFIFSMNIKDGDLSPCLDLSYVYSEKNRRHYNFKDINLPKGQYVRGNESIETWRRLE